MGTGNSTRQPAAAKYVSKHQVGRRRPSEQRHLLFEEPRRPVVVAVEKREAFAARRGDSGVAGSGRADHFVQLGPRMAKVVGQAVFGCRPTHDSVGAQG